MSVKQMDGYSDERTLQLGVGGVDETCQKDIYSKSRSKFGFYGKKWDKDILI